jgi:macrolide-specific efflux system membrane fusion protein
MSLVTTEAPATTARPAARVAAPRVRRWRPLVLGIAALVLAGAGWWGWKTWFGAGDAASQFTASTAQRGDLEDTVTATGTLQPRDYVDVGTQVSGQLKKLHVVIGQVVKQGDLLAEIDPTVFQSKVDAGQAQLANLRAQLADKEAQRTLAEQQAKRQQSLQREDATTTEAVQQAEATLQSTTAQIAALRAQIRQVESTLRGDQANLGYTKIYAPMAGTVVSQIAKQGQTLNANQQAPIIVRIADLSTMTVQTQVSEADVSKLRLGMDVYFTTLGGGGKRYYGKLRQVNPTPTITNNVVLYDALFDVPNPAGDLMTQMTAQVFFVAAEAKDALLVPVSALSPARASGDGKRAAKKAGAAAVGPPLDPRERYMNKPATVRVVNDDGSVEERAVQVGAMNRVAAQIVSGLEPGEKVVSGTRTAGARSPASGTQPRMQPRL